MSDTASESQSSTLPAKPRPNLAFAIVGLLILGGIIYWGFTQKDPYGETPPQAPVVTPEPPTPPATIEPAQPTIAEEEPSTVIPEREPEPTPEPPAAPAITLAEADSLITGDVQALNGGAVIEQFVMQPNVIERGTGVVDMLRQGSVPYKLLPVGRPERKFPISDNGLAVTMDPDGFNRYDGLASVVEKLDVAAAVDLIERYEAAINEAWNLMGYSDTDFNGALMGALALVLTAPETNTEARLIKREANWIYEDETLEALPDIQKQLMRMGPDNAETVKDKARELRSALLDAGIAE